MFYFKIDTKNPTVWIQKAGYTPHKGGFVLDDEQGRFHAKCHQNTIDVHYDLIVGYKHVVFDLPDKLTEEETRIRTFLPPPIKKLPKYKPETYVRVDGESILYKNKRKANRRFKGFVIY